MYSNKHVYLKTGGVEIGGGGGGLQGPGPHNLQAGSIHVSWLSWTVAALIIIRSSANSGLWNLDNLNILLTVN